MYDDKPHHECGVFGIYAPDEDVARLTFFGLYALQHRGQESAGIAVSDGRRMYTHKDMGLVAQVFTEESLRPLHGHLAIGHTRYSTTGSSKIQNAQPFLVESALGLPPVKQPPLRLAAEQPLPAPGTAAAHSGEPRVVFERSSVGTARIPTGPPA